VPPTRGLTARRHVLHCPPAARGGLRDRDHRDKHEVRAAGAPIGAYVEGQVALGEHRQDVVDPSVSEQIGIGIGIAMDEVADADNRVVLPAVETA
jgi:hypothetical protein